LGSLILAAVAGALIFLLALTTAVYRGRAISAEMKRDEAVTVAAKSLEAKQNAEDGFSKIKLIFEERAKLPLLAMMTDEQVQNIANFLAEKLFMSNARMTDKIQ